MASGPPIPLHVFRFQVDFFTDSLTDDGSHEQFQVCSGAFAECTGLEATMEAKVAPLASPSITRTSWPFCRRTAAM